MMETERRYHACKREAVAVIFALKKYRVYLLSSFPFTFITDHDSLRYAFSKRDIHGRPARWMDFLAEYDFKVIHRKGKANVVPDFLSRMGGEAPAEDATDEGDLVCTIEERSDAYEDSLVKIGKFPEKGVIESKDVTERRKVRRQSVRFVMWQGRLFRREGQKVVTVVPINHRSVVFRFMHDSMGHWDATTTRKMVSDRYWWPNVGKETFQYVKTCDTCQRMAKLPSYHTWMTRPITSLFEVFSIDFAGPLPQTRLRNRFLLACVEHLTSWSIVVPTRHTTAEVVRNFMSTEIIQPFGIPNTVVSDNAQCFTAAVMTEFNQQQGIERKTVLAYAPMSNGRAERMVKNIKAGIKKLALDGGIDWDEDVRKVVYGYRRRPLVSGFSPFELMYGIPPRLVQDDGRREESPTSSLADRRAELLSLMGKRASRALKNSSNMKKDG